MLRAMRNTIPYLFSCVLLIASLSVACNPNPRVGQTASQSESAPGAPATVKPTGAKEVGQAKLNAGKKGWVLRSTEVIKREGNHLKSSGSVYLRQHANNPLEWYPWGKEALERSKKEDKPIFLSIGYSSCHWCHVMEHKVFEHDDVAAFMNANFICIKVDREERPDLDEVYMSAVQRMTGRGGWPMTVFLTPGLKPFVGGTYFPKRRFMTLARKVLDEFKNKRQEIEERGEGYYQQIAKKVPQYTPSTLTEDFLRGVATRTAERMDPVWGGFKSQRRNKFPVPSRWTYLMHAYRKWGDESVKKALSVTLNQMASGGMYDHVGGGFCRYSTDPRWIVPHFEKMLYDNTQLISLYIEAGTALADPHYDAVAQDIMEFMLREWHPKGGAFYASYDADSGGHEGSFYVWTPEEINRLAGPKDGPPLAMLLGVNARGNFEGKTIPTRRVSHKTVAAQFKMSEAAVAALWPKYRANMLAIRSKRVAPGLDKKFVTGWNGLAIGAFAQGYRAYGDARYLKAAEETADFLWRVHRRPSWGFYRASNGGKPVHAGVLDDYAFVADGMLDLYLVTGNVKHLKRVMTLVREVGTHFVDPNGGWFFTEKNAETPLGRQVVPWDSVRPSGMSRMVRTLLRVSALTGSTQYDSQVQRTLRRYSTLMRRSQMGMAGWLTVDLWQKGPFYEAIVAGDPSHPGTQKLVAAYAKLRPSWSVSLVVPGTGASPALRKLVPPTMGKVARKGQAYAYVCVKGTCNKPTSVPGEFVRQLKEGWKK
jgi:uncharacterized protein YyaL (SSP411 family)